MKKIFKHFDIQTDLIIVDLIAILLTLKSLQE